MLIRAPALPSVRAVYSNQRARMAKPGRGCQNIRPYVSEAMRKLPPRNSWGFHAAAARELNFELFESSGFSRRSMKLMWASMIIASLESGRRSSSLLLRRAQPVAEFVVLVFVVSEDGLDPRKGLGIDLRQHLRRRRAVTEDREISNGIIPDNSRIHPLPMARRSVNFAARQPVVLDAQIEHNTRAGVRFSDRARLRLLPEPFRNEHHPPRSSLGSRISLESRAWDLMTFRPPGC